MSVNNEKNIILGLKRIFIEIKYNINYESSMVTNNKHDISNLRGSDVLIKECEFKLDKSIQTNDNCLQIKGKPAQIEEMSAKPDNSSFLSSNEHFKMYLDSPKSSPRKPSNQKRQKISIYKEDKGKLSEDLFDRIEEVNYGDMNIADKLDFVINNIENGDFRENEVIINETSTDDGKEHNKTLNNEVLNENTTQEYGSSSTNFDKSIF